MHRLLPLFALGALACGTLNDTVGEVESGDRDQNAIVGGSDAMPGQFPHQVSLQSRYGSHFCGASVIGEQWILTAAHCVDGESASGLRVRVDSVYRNSGGATYNISQVVVHPSYNDYTQNADVALLRVSGTMDVEPIRLANNTADDTIAAPGVYGSVSGWGALSEGGSSPNRLQFVEVPMLTNASCNVSYNGDITNNMVCAGYPQGGQDSCQGDSGGPLVVDNGGEWVQNGVVSWGHGCARPGKPGVYARISQFQSWVESYVPDVEFTSGGNGGGTTDPTPPSSDATIFVDGQTVIDSFLSAGETEVYTLVVPESQTLTIFTTGSTDTYGSLTGQGQTTNDDDSGQGYNFKMTPSVTAGEYYLEIRGYSTSTTGDFQLVVNGVETDTPAPTPEPEPEPEIPEADILAEVDLSGSSNSEQRFTLDVPAGQSVAEFVITGGTGDADLYVKYGAQATTTNYDCRPYRNGNEETCTISSPPAGTYHVMVRGYTSYSGLTLAGSSE